MCLGHELIQIQWESNLDHLNEINNRLQPTVEVTIWCSDYDMDVTYMNQRTTITKKCFIGLFNSLNSQFNGNYTLELINLAFINLNWLKRKFNFLSLNGKYYFERVPTSPNSEYSINQIFLRTPIL